MTKEEIVALKSRVEAFCPKPASADQIHLHVLKALSSLTEAYEEIARLEAFSVMDDTFLTEAYAEIEELKNRVHVVLDCNSFKREGRHWAACPFYVAESTT